MNKKLTTTLAIGATVIGVVVFAQDVHAADSPTPEQDAANNLVTKTKENEVKKEDVAKAKVEADQANANVEAKKKEAADKSDKVTKADEKVEEKQKDFDSVEKVTPDKIKEAQSKVDNIKEDKAKAETLKLQAEVAKEEIDKDIARKTQEAENKLKEAAEKQEQIKDIEKQLKELKDSTKLLEEKKIEKEQATQDLENAKNDLEKHKKELEEVIKSDAKQNEEIEKLVKKVEEQNKKVKEIEKKLELAKQAESKAKSKIDNAVNPFGSAKTTLKVSDDFVRRFNEFKANPSVESFNRVVEAEQADKENVLKQLNPNDYKNDTDLVDLKNMSDKDKELFSQYFTHLLNQVREQFGLPPHKYNLNTQKFADEIARIAMEGKFDKERQYIKGIKEAARLHGLSDRGNDYENKEYSYAPIKDGSKVSRRYLFDILHNSVQKFFYSGKTNGHYGDASFLLGAQENIALSFIPTPKKSEGNTLVKISVISVSQASVGNNNKYEEKYSKNSPESIDNVQLPGSKVLEDAYNVAKENTGKIQSELNDANKVLEQAKTDHKAKTDSLENKVDEAQTAKDLAEKTVEKLKQKEAQKEEDIARLQGNVDAETEKRTRLNKELGELKKELEDIKAEATTKEQEVTELKRLSESRAEEIVKLEVQIDEIDKLLAQATTELEDQQRLDASRGAVKQALTKAQEELKIAQEELELANGELKSLQKIAQDKQDRYKTIKKQYELGDYLHATTKDAPILEKPEFKFEIPKDALTVEKPEFDISTLNKPTNPTTKAKEKEIVVNQKQGAILPKTGENTKSSVVVGLVLLAASIIIKRRKAR
ncbi:LPXTG cell wall anchor domain-containing protein [Gemella morbillorum]|uniref:LPXTG cell wall anchor domain-containing protein n=1 Tax=Gemella morbillorum TaxID=29391 RepID=UPI00356A69FD